MSKNQNWFNKEYSEKEDIAVEDKKLKLKGFLKIKDFKKLKKISLKKVELTNLEISDCTQLIKINLLDLSKLTSLSITKCPKLNSFDCSTTVLTNLIISYCSQLDKIDLSRLTKLVSLSVIECSNLTKLDCLSEELTSLKISGCSQLNDVDLSRLTNLESLSVTKCPISLDRLTTKLKSLEINGSLLENIGLTQLTKLVSLSVIDCSKLIKLDCSSEELTSLKISGCSQLEKIDLSKLTKLESLSIIECSKLTRLDCLSQKLNSLEIVNCTQLKKITDSFRDNPKSLCVRGYSNLTELDCSETGFTILKIISCSQLNGVNLSTLPKITSLSVIDCSKLTKFDCSSNVLTNLEISDCYRLNDVDLSKLSNLTSLFVIDCPKLTKLDCSSINTLTELEVSDLPELNCSNTSIKELSLNLCPNIKKINCSNNGKLIKLDVNNCFKLESIECSNCSNSNFTRLDVSYCPENIKTINPPKNLVIIREKKIFKNILIVGRTGGGKSTLANVLANTDEFGESAYAVSETKDFRKKEFKWKDIDFRVVDTIGAGDTKLDLKKTLYRIANGIYSMPEGISQILFVVDRRFKNEEINTFNMVKGSILEIKILDYVTLVRTKFNNFRNEEECGIDIGKMKNESKSIAKIVNSCYGVIHVDNPSLNIEAADDDDDDDLRTQVKVSKKIREKSRIILLDYLVNVPPIKENKYFRLKTWNKLQEIIKTIAKPEVGDKDIQEMLKNDSELEAVCAVSRELCLIL